MNADAYLRKQGWKGSGHSLDSTGRGIKKPLLIAHKQDQLGLGKKKAAYTTDDQWWMRAYDQSLQSIGTGKDSTLNQIRTQGINRGGLYAFFVKGEAIQGTIEDTSVPPSGRSTPATSTSDTEGTSATKKLDKKNKRKREETEMLTCSKRSRKGRKDAKSVKKEAKKAAEMDAAAQKRSSGSSDCKEQAAVAAKLAKMKPAEKAEYQARASEKGQSLAQYVLRRIQKRGEKRAKYVNTSFDSPFFFVDMEGDRNLPNQIATPSTYYKPRFDRLLPLGLNPTIWERQVLELMHAGHRAEQCKHEEAPRTASFALDTRLTAREPRQAGTVHKHQLHSTKAAAQSQTTDPTGNEDNLAPALPERLDDGHWTTSRAVRQPEHTSHTSLPEITTMAVLPQRAFRRKG